MSRQTARACPGSDRTNLYDEITNTIIAELETGHVPWVQPWGTTAKAPLGMPKNGATGRLYSGINVLILWGTVIKHGFPGQSLADVPPGAEPRRQRSKRRAWHHGRLCRPLHSREDEKKRAVETGEEALAIPFLKRFTVFNLAQAEGLPDEIAVSVPPPEPGLIEPRVEALIKATGIDFRIGGDRAFYMPSYDYVQVPPPQAYFEPINWHRTALHECGHASGARHRLNRDLSGSFGSKKYAFEELVAEMSAAFCCASLGIVPTVRHADYIGSWIEVLREENRTIVRAARQASKAADYLLGFLADASTILSAETEREVA